MSDGIDARREMEEVGLRFDPSSQIRPSELVDLARALDALYAEDEKVNNARGLCNTSARLEAMGAVLQAWACVRHRVLPNK
jgi:hypothetical protein